jgi:hypothetical protein
MLWAQWTLLVLWTTGLAFNLYEAGKDGKAREGVTHFLAATVVLVIYFFAGAFDQIL